MDIEEIEFDDLQRFVEKSIKTRYAASVRWSRERMRQMFLSQVILEPERNEVFRKRFEKAEKMNYKIHLETLQGKFKEIQAFRVTSPTGKSYLTRVFNGKGNRALASCTCPDFQRNKRFKVPCKHIWFVLKQGENG